MRLEGEREGQCLLFVLGPTVEEALLDMLSFEAGFWRVKECDGT